MLDSRRRLLNTQDKAFRHSHREMKGVCSDGLTERKTTRRHRLAAPGGAPGGRPASYNELAAGQLHRRRMVADRVRRLEDAGVAGYQARVDPARAGLPWTAFVQMRCRLDRCLLKTSQASDYPEIEIR